MITTRCFNSRTREGCDNAKPFTFWEVSIVSIHAPGRGATIYYDFYRRQDYVSIHAPGRGATPAAEYNKALDVVSIHAPGRGATVWCKVAYYGADKQA